MQKARKTKGSKIKCGEEKCVRWLWSRLKSREVFYLFWLKSAFGNTQRFDLLHKSNFASQNSSPIVEICQSDWKLRLVCSCRHHLHHRRLNWMRQNCSKAGPKTGWAPVKYMRLFSTRSSWYLSSSATILHRIQHVRQWSPLFSGSS